MVSSAPRYADAPASLAKLKKSGAIAKILEKWGQKADAS